VELLLRVVHRVRVDDLEVAPARVVPPKGKDQEVPPATEDVIRLSGAASLPFIAEIRDGLLGFQHHLLAVVSLPGELLLPSIFAPSGAFQEPT
jgi:hypothetical protein